MNCVCTCLGSCSGCNTHSTPGTLHNLNKQLQQFNTQARRQYNKICMHHDLLTTQVKVKQQIKLLLSVINYMHDAHDSYFN